MVRFYRGLEKSYDGLLDSVKAYRLWGIWVSLPGCPNGRAASLSTYSKQRFGKPGIL